MMVCNHKQKKPLDIIRAAHLPFIVALNKIDKPEADPNRVMGQLAEFGVTVGDWGGSIPMARIRQKPDKESTTCLILYY